MWIRKNTSTYYTRTSLFTLLQIMEIVYLDHGIIFIKLMTQTQNNGGAVKLAGISKFWVRSWRGVVRLWESHAKNKQWNRPWFLLWQNLLTLGTWARKLWSIPKVPWGKLKFWGLSLIRSVWCLYEDYIWHKRKRQWDSLITARRHKECGASWGHLTSQDEAPPESNMLIQDLIIKPRLASNC